jgi:hypothetical protein
MLIRSKNFEDWRLYSCYGEDHIGCPVVPSGIMGSSRAHTVTRSINYKIRTQDPCAPETGLTGDTDKKSGAGICNLWNSLFGIQGADEQLPRQPRNGVESRN